MYCDLLQPCLQWWTTCLDPRQQQPCEQSWLLCAAPKRCTRQVCRRRSQPLEGTGLSCAQCLCCRHIVGSRQRASRATPACIPCHPLLCASPPGRTARTWCTAARRGCWRRSTFGRLNSCWQRRRCSSAAWAADACLCAPSLHAPKLRQCWQLLGSVQACSPGACAAWPTVRRPVPSPQALAPNCAQLQNDSTLRVMLSLLMPELSLQSQAIKLQWNAGARQARGGGGCCSCTGCAARTWAAQGCRRPAGHSWWPLACLCCLRLVRRPSS